MVTPQDFLSDLHARHDSVAHGHIFGYLNDSDKLVSQALPVDEFIKYGALLASINYDDKYCSINIVKNVTVELMKLTWNHK
ncbi:hypothetical protein [Erysipelothrix aquatica]|uniref:hypothetical protein n=1 Tax=Erysipelothrix aquatica TaxID=2683714 RepID=UPI001359560F|nr:hypothetical protein [Erysipelothrix aquatica]